jgi:hypothetical protein
MDETKTYTGTIYRFYIIKTITSFPVRIGLSGSLFVYEGYIATSYVSIVNVIIIIFLLEFINNLADPSSRSP